MRPNLTSLQKSHTLLDLIVFCWRTEKSRHGTSCALPSRDLRIAVQSGFLTEAESAALTEIIEMLDLAVTQAVDAGMRLPMLAGIGVAVVDGYRDVRSHAAAADNGRNAR